MPDNFSIRVGTSGEIALVRVTGRLEAKCAAELMERCRTVFTQGHKYLVLNLANVDFIASSGIGTILALREEVLEGDGAVRLAEPSPAVQAVIKLLNLAQFLSIDASEAEALDAIQKGARRAA